MTAPERAHKDTPVRFDLRNRSPLLPNKLQDQMGAGRSWVIKMKKSVRVLLSATALPCTEVVTGIRVNNDVDIYQSSLGKHKEKNSNLLSPVQICSVAELCSKLGSFPSYPQSCCSTSYVESGQHQEHRDINTEQLPSSHTCRADPGEWNGWLVTPPF